MGAIRKHSASEQQKAFVDYLVAGRHNITEAARLAGYAHPKQSGHRLTRNPAVGLMLRQARQSLYQCDLANLAGETLRVVMTDPDAPASAKVSAARTALELAGDLGKNAEGGASGKSLAEMSPDELGSMIEQWETERSAMARDVTAQET